MLLSLQNSPIKLDVDIDPPSTNRLENHLWINPTPFYTLTLHKRDPFAGLERLRLV